MTQLTPEQQWFSTIGEMQMLVSRTVYETWLRDTMLLAHDPDTNAFTVGVENAYARDYIESRLRSALQRTLSCICGKPAELNLVLSPHSPDAETVDDDGEDPEEGPRETDWEGLGVPRILAGESLDTLDWSWPSLQKPELRDYAANALRYFDEGIGLTLIGPKGTGKTHVAVGLLKAAVMDGRSATFAGAVDVFDRLRATIDSERRSSEKEQRIINSLVDPDLLALDDLRASSLTGWACERLYVIANARWERGLPTIVTTNYTPDELAYTDKRAGLDEGTHSRLFDAALTIRLEGPDYRAERKRRAVARLRQSDASRNAIASISQPEPPPRRGE